MVGKTENINMNMYKRLKTTTHTRAVWATGHESSDSPGQARESPATPPSCTLMGKAGKWIKCF